MSEFKYVFYKEGDTNKLRPYLNFRNNKEFYDEIQNYKNFIDTNDYSCLYQAAGFNKILALAEETLCKKLGITPVITGTDVKKFVEDTFKQARCLDDRCCYEYDALADICDIYTKVIVTPHINFLGIASLTDILDSEYDDCYRDDEDEETEEKDVVIFDGAAFAGGELEHLSQEDKEYIQSMAQYYKLWADDPGGDFALDLLFVECPVEDEDLAYWLATNLPLLHVVADSKTIKVKGGYIIAYIVSPKGYSDGGYYENNEYNPLVRTISLREVMCELYERFGAEQGWWEHPNTKIS